MSKHLHIISFDIPYPADYGGVIDVFYKLKAFHKAGILVHMHCFEYGREHSEELNKYCQHINYYKRSTGLKSNLSTIPYIVKSRLSKELESRLLTDSYPILCEGMHTCGIIESNKFTNRKIIYRAANIEHDYYTALYKAENSIIKRAYYFIEANKLKKWEHKLSNVDLILTLSINDERYYKNLFPKKDVINTFPFFNNDINIKPNFKTKDKYILFHAKLSVQENIDAALYIIKTIAPKIDARFIIAGLEPDASIISAANSVENIEIKANLSESNMQSLLNNAHINILTTKQSTGLKLKLINSLYQSKYIIANNEMLSGSGLDKLVEIANTSSEIISKSNELLEKSFTEIDYEKRMKMIPKEYNNKKRIEEVIKLIYNKHE